MMIKKIFPLIVVLLTSCVSESSCPEYPASKLSWLPYRLNNIMKFTNNIDTISFNVNESFASQASLYREDCDCGCNVQAYFKTDFNDKIDMKINGESVLFDDITHYTYSFVKNGCEHNYEDFGFSFYNNELNREIYSEYIIGNMTYNNVIEIKLDTINYNSLALIKPPIWRLLIADNVGIIQFDECKSTNSWIRIE